MAKKKDIPEPIIEVPEIEIVVVETPKVEPVITEQQKVSYGQNP